MSYAGSNSGTSDGNGGQMGVRLAIWQFKIKMGCSWANLAVYDPLSTLQALQTIHINVTEIISIKSTNDKNWFLGRIGG